MVPRDTTAASNLPLEIMALEHGVEEHPLLCGRGDDGKGAAETNCGPVK